MPANFAHYLFGTELLDRLPNSLQEIIWPNLALYQIGQHGPDIIFYYRPFLPHSASRIGFQLHKQPARNFFQQAQATIIRQQDPQLLAYTLGFLCHFILDSNCHRYIYQKIQDGRVAHAEIETEFDRLLMLRHGLDPLHTDPTSHLSADPVLCQLISHIFVPLTADEISEGLRTMKWVHRLRISPSPSSRYTLRRLIHLTRTEQYLGGLVVNPVANPLCWESNQTLQALFQRSLEEAGPLLWQFCDSLASGAPLGPRYDRTFQA